MKLSIRPRTPDLRPPREGLFGRTGAGDGCRCMYWRIGGGWRKGSRDDDQAALREIVERGPPPGPLAFAGDVAEGWCQLTPRAALPWPNRSRRCRPVDDPPVWSLTGLYVRKGCRRQDIVAALVAAAMRRASAAALEAYPLDAGKSPSASGTG